MSSRTADLLKISQLETPSWFANSVIYEAAMGSTAYGVSTDTSDVDIYGICVPPARIVFPHTIGEVEGFTSSRERFDQWQQHHVRGYSGETYDFAIFNIVKWMDLTAAGNPNMIDSIFVPQECVVYATQAGWLIRENRRLFLHKGLWHKFRGYAHSQLHKIAIKTPQPGSKRAANVEAHGYDTKFAYHVVRLLLEIEQILETHDLDMRRDSELLKTIRRGEWSEPDIRAWVASKEKRTEELYHDSKIPHSPDRDAIKDVMLRAIRMTHGQLPKEFVEPSRYIAALHEIKSIFDRLEIK